MTQLRILDWKNRVASWLRKLRFRYQLPRRPSRYLSATSLQPEPTYAETTPTYPQGELFEIWRSIPNGFKWLHYFPIYERILSEFRTRPIRFLEIGVYHGSSLQMWKRYFHPDSVILGIDIDPTCINFENSDSNIHVRIGDQSDTAFLQSVIQEFGPFDVILDDGSHLCSDMIKTFDYAFLNGLTDAGVYFVEDTHTNFWGHWRDQPYSFVDLCKDLVDYSHSHYWGQSGIDAFAFETPKRISSISVPRIGREIEEIRFFDSIIVIRRNKYRALPVVEHL